VNVTRKAMKILVVLVAILVQIIILTILAFSIYHLLQDAIFGIRNMIDFLLEEFEEIVIYLEDLIKVQLLIHLKVLSIKNNFV
jgi:hypothetical protein